MALQSRHAAQGLTRDLRDRSQAVCRRARQRPPPASGQVRQSGNVELPVRVRVGLIAGARASRPLLYVFKKERARRPRSAPLYPLLRELAAGLGLLAPILHAL